MVLTLQMPVTAEDFDAVYASARGDISLVPWAKDRPHPGLVTWLNVIAPSHVRCGARVAVVGCGLGHDARELRRRGHDVTAFDVSEAAIAWAKTIDPAHGDCFQVADLFEPPARWRHRFDLVVEINNIQALPPGERPEVVRSIANLMSPHGALLVIARAAEDPVHLEAGPPWPLTETELREATREAGLRPEGPISVFSDDAVPPVLRLRALFHRSAG